MYSQNQEEKYILQFFGDFVGGLLDIGANDGFTFSNSMALIERDWTADLVEPSPKAYKKLEKLYWGNHKVFVWNCAITEKTGESEFYESGPLISSKDIALVSSVKKTELERWSKIDFKKTKVGTMTINDLSNYADCPIWDFISIDAEGYDLEILRQIDLTYTKLLCIEWNSIEETKKAILDYTSKFKMNKILYTSGENLLICQG